mmetsp:Transcript_35039/g.54754  ORF Transcript_35039/g.54754 Transcript_35039/m.54754 type:complete len:80 (-) Transcript_35039:763-1002(-)
MNLWPSTPHEVESYTPNHQSHTHKTQGLASLHQGNTSGQAPNPKDTKAAEPFNLNSIFYSTKSTPPFFDLNAPVPPSPL